MDIWYRVIGGGPAADGMAAAASALGARPLPEDPAQASGQVLVLPADGAGLDAEALQALVGSHTRRGATLTLALDEEAGAVGFDGDPIPAPLVVAWDRLTEGQRALALHPERLPDLVASVRQAGGRVAFWRAAQTDGRMDRLLGLQASGVKVLDPATTWVDDAAVIAAGAVLLPFTVVEGACVIGAGCRVGPGSHLRESRLGRGVHVWYSVIEESHLGDGVQVGPYAHLRPGCDLGPRVRVGNFVELKNAKVGADARLPHHTYMGEVDIGAAANIGAGAVVVNYDGRKKRRARIGAGVMLGCNSNLLAPAQVGDNGYVAAGSTVTEDVPPGALAVGRGPQKNVEGWVERRLGPGTASGIPKPE